MPTISREDAKFIFDHILDEPRYDYSGRGMYGNTCFGAVTERGHEWDIFSALREELAVWTEEDDQFHVVEYMLEHKPETDSMGLGVILYWPGVKVEG